MPNVREILKNTGLTDEQINAIDARAITAIEGMATSAEQQAAQAAQSALKAEQDRQSAQAAQQAAELAQRSNVEFYETKIVPSLTGWETEQKKLQTDVTNAAAEAAYYKTLIDKAKENGFVPGNTPAFATPTPTNPTQTRDGNGRFVPGPEGSPVFIDELRRDVGSALGTLTDIQWKYQTLFGQPLPISPTQLIQEAEQQKLDPLAYASRKYNFAGREQEIAQQKAKEHDAQIAAAATLEAETKKEAEIAKLRTEYEAKLKTSAETRGNNPDVHAAPGSSKYTDVRKAVAEGTMPDPLKMTDAERRAATRRVIHEEISANSAEAA